MGSHLQVWPHGAADDPPILRFILRYPLKMVIFHSYVSLPEGNDYIMGLMSLMIGHASTNWFLLVSYDLNVTVMPSLAWKVGSSTGSFHFEPENR